MDRRSSPHSTLRTLRQLEIRLQIILHEKIEEAVVVLATPGLSYFHDHVEDRKDRVSKFA